MPVTFDVDPTKKPEGSPPSATIEEYLEPDIGVDRYASRSGGNTKPGGKLIKASNSSENYVKSNIRNGFVGACLTAYNQHYDLQLGPDDVWITIMTSLSRYINANAEKLRNLFVSHEGQVELKAFGSGSIYSANYDDLISQISDQIDKNTKGELRSWAESSFSTTTPLQKIVSKVTLMGAMQKYFSYGMYLMCGLPKVTLLGTVEDWNSILARIGKIGELEDKTLQEWSKVLEFVMQNFVSAFNGSVDVDFWNRIAHITGGGSGPRYIEGWVLALLGFGEKGEYLLQDLKSIKATNKFGRLDTNKVPPSVVAVPVKIDDNGKEHNTKFFAGAMLASFDGKTISPTLDWAIVDFPDEN